MRSHLRQQHLQAWQRLVHILCHINLWNSSADVLKIHVFFRFNSWSAKVLEPCRAQHQLHTYIKLPRLFEFELTIPEFPEILRTKNWS